MSLNPQCYATLPVGITAENTREFTGLNNCLSSCRNGLRATYWSNVSPYRQIRLGAFADQSGSQWQRQLSVFMCDSFKLW